MYCLSVLVLTVLAVVFVVVSARQYCPKNNQNVPQDRSWQGQQSNSSDGTNNQGKIYQDTLAFRGRSGGVVYIRISKYITLRCCMTGYTNVRWKKWNQLHSRYIDYPWDEGREDVDIVEDGQVLEITLVRAYDEGKYICVGENNSSTIQHEVLLKVISCEATDGKIYIVEEPVGPVTASPGDRIKWKCKGYFGCESEGSQYERIAQWQYNTSNGFHTIRNLSDSYQLYDDPSSGNETVGSILVINKVEEKDYHRTFNCLLQTPGRHKTFSINISRPVTIPDNRLYFICLVLLIPLILLLILLMYCLYGPRIQYWCKIKCPCSAYSPDKDGLEHDVLIIRSDNDKDKAFVEEHVKPHIKDYKVFDKDSVHPGQIENLEMTEAVTKSYSIVIIYSKHLLMDRDARYVFQIIRGVGHRRVVVIKLENISKAELKSIISDEILKIASSVLPSITWPTTGTANSRKYKNFIYDLKNKLLKNPIPIRRRSEEVRDVASSRRGTSSPRPLPEASDVASSRRGTHGSSSSEQPLLSQISNGSDSGYGTTPDVNVCDRYEF